MPKLSIFLHYIFLDLTLKPLRTIVVKGFLTGIQAVGLRAELGNCSIKQGLEVQSISLLNGSLPTASQPQSIELHACF